MSEQEPIYIVFDGPPGPTSGHFIEVENAEGKGRSVGEWKQDGAYWKLGPLYAAPGSKGPQPDPAASALEDAFIYAANAERILRETVDAAEAALSSANALSAELATQRAEKSVRIGELEQELADLQHDNARLVQISTELAGERERCAKVVDEFASNGCLGCATVAAAIRAGRVTTSAP